MNHEIADGRICFWCRQIRQKIFVYDLGSVTPSYNPCDTCRRSWDRGIAAIEISFEPNSPQQPPITPQMMSAFPTGRWAVVEKVAAEFLGFPKEALTRGMCIMTRHGYEALLSPHAAKTSHLLSRTQ